MTTRRRSAGPAGISALLGLVRRWIHLLRRPARVRRYLRENPDRWLHIGCGEHAIEGWLNTDLVPRIPDAVFMDARSRFPFPNECFELVFSEHLIEHLTYQQGEGMLREVFRTLVPGGLLRVATPDLRFLFELYSSDESELSDRYVEWALRHSNLPDPGVHREVIVINHFFRAWNHAFIYDFETLSALARRIGFGEVRRCAVGSSDSPGLQKLESHGRIIPEEFNVFETFVLEARKPIDAGTLGRVR
jgi:predicted SAM-dependent methyltransferase